MKFILSFLVAFGTFSIINAQSVSYEFKVENPTKNNLIDCVVEIPLADLKNLPMGIYMATDGNMEVPVEIATDIRGNSSLIFPVALLESGEEKKILIKPGNAIAYPKKTYAEIVHKTGGQFEGNKYKGGFSWVKPNYLRKPDNFKDHAYYIKYEGPGWESDKVAFRFYLDQRNAIDVFGKKTPGIVLPFVGVDGYENYHTMADWGMDNMKVGKALGIGTIAVWDGKKAIRVEKTDSVISYIPMDGKVRSQVKTTYYGWNANNIKCTLQSQISIDAGSRASHMELLADKKINICTGINKDANAEFFTGKSGSWTYIASFGKQSINNDMMGLALFVRTSQLKEITGDELNHVVLLNTDQEGYVDYYFMPTWELDWDPVVTKSDFQRCINEVLLRLNYPIWK